MRAGPLTLRSTWGKGQRYGLLDDAVWSCWCAGFMNNVTLPMFSNVNVTLFRSTFYHSFVSFDNSYRDHSCTLGLKWENNLALCES